MRDNDHDKQVAELLRTFEVQGKQLAWWLECLEALGFDTKDMAADAGVTLE